MDTQLKYILIILTGVIGYATIALYIFVKLYGPNAPNKHAKCPNCLKPIPRASAHIKSAHILPSINPLGTLYHGMTMCGGCQSPLNITVKRLPLAIRFLALPVIMFATVTFIGTVQPHLIVVILIFLSVPAFINFAILKHRDRNIIVTIDDLE